MSHSSGRLAEQNAERNSECTGLIHEALKGSKVCTGNLAGAHSCHILARNLAEF